MRTLRTLILLLFRKLTHDFQLSKGNLLIAGLSFLGFGYLVSLVLFIGFNLHEWVNEENLVFALLIYSVYDFFIRFFGQKIHPLPAQVLYMPVTRRSLTHAILLLHLGNGFNILPFALWLPFLLLHVSNSAYWIWILVSLVICSNYLSLLLHNQSSVRMKVASYVAFFIISFGLASWSLIVGRLAAQIMAANELMILSIAWTFSILAYIINFRLVSGKLNLDSFSRQEIKERNWISRLFDLSTGLISNQLLLLELKLIFRNKRPLTYLALSILFTLYLGYLVIEDFSYGSFGFLLVMTLVTGSTLIFYSQYLFSWESEYFEFVLLYAKSWEYVKAKFYILYALFAVNTLCTLPLLSVDRFGLSLLSVSLYHVGISVPLVIYLSTRNAKRVALGRGSFLNYEGTTLNTFIVILAAVASPLIVWLPFFFLHHVELAFITLLIIGLLGLVSREYLLNVIFLTFQNRKHRMLMDFQVRD